MRVREFPRFPKFQDYRHYRPDSAGIVCGVAGGVQRSPDKFPLQAEHWFRLEKLI